MTTRAKNQVVILGSGTSTGVPLVGCRCEVCLSPSPFNKRFRTSIFLHTQKDKKILIDTTPDLRSQLLANQLAKIDATIITHDHADHTHGIDDLRPLGYFHGQADHPVFTDEATAESLRARFPYIFQREKLFPANRPVLGGGIPLLRLQLLSPNTSDQLNKTADIVGEEMRFFHVPHGYTQTLCFIHHKFGYITDCKVIPPHVLQAFKEAKLELLIIDCLQEKPRDRLTHLTLDDSLKYIERIAPQKAGLIHLSHSFDHHRLEDQLSSRYAGAVFPLFDGQVLEYDALS